MAKQVDAGSIRRRIAVGVLGSAAVGVGVAWGATLEAPDSAVTEVRLVSTESMLPLAPPDCLNTDSGTSGCGINLRAGGAPTPPALAAANAQWYRPMFGNGGWLIGNGLTAAEDCEAAACRGGNGGLLWGNGGDGRYGWDGGDAGFLFGNGGRGGNGLDAEYDLIAQERTSEATIGGNGGRGGLLFGRGGDGGDGGRDENRLDTAGENDAKGAQGGNGGQGGRLGGDGGSGGWGGDAFSANGNAEAGGGGAGGTSTGEVVERVATAAMRRRRSAMRPPDRAA